MNRIAVLGTILMKLLSSMTAVTVMEYVVNSCSISFPTAGIVKLVEVLVVVTETERALAGIHAPNWLLPCSWIY